jgi:3-methyladenine DNA glycosylase AlkD
MPGGIESGTRERSQTPGSRSCEQNRHAMNTSQSAGTIVRETVRHLKQYGCPAHAAGAQRYFKEEIRSHGWRTADLRRYARTVRRTLAPDPLLLMDVAEQLFARPVLEEKALGVEILRPSLRHFGDAEFRRLSRWLERVVSWADHDALVSYLIGPLLVADPRRVSRAIGWASSASRWRRRAAAVSLIRGIRAGLFAGEARTVTDRLLADRDDMVQKGLGWLLREWAKYHPAEAVPVLLEIRDRASRLVLRTACERLGQADRARILRQ